MKLISLIAMCVLAILALIPAILFLPRHDTVVYNCTWAEISPDIPIKVKEECRKQNTL